ncbi:MAG TPA: YoaK family protein [Magnetospirillaceae bacterium]|jgi:uncharacterized membrane protein YoaK (UPF0700 family)
MKPTLPLLLSLNGGYVDTAGFLALQGLFTAHVTGNLVTAGAAVVFGTSGVVSKLLAIPVFCLVVMAVRGLGATIGHSTSSTVRILLGIKLTLLIVAAILALELGPFPDGDALPALVTGLTLVAAMAVQNAVQRIHMPTAPTTTIMTGNTTQLMIDLADVLRGAPEAVPGQSRARLKRTAGNMLTFVFGCAAAAAMFFYTQMWCFVVPPVLALIAVLVRAEFPPPAPAPAPAKAA